MADRAIIALVAMRAVLWMRIRIRLITLMQIQMRGWILIFIWCRSGCGFGFLFDADADADADADPDADADADQDLDPDPGFQIKDLEKVLKYAYIPYILTCRLQIDVDPIPDPAYRFDQISNSAATFLIVHRLSLHRNFQWCTDFLIVHRHFQKCANFSYSAPTFLIVHLLFL